MGYPKNRWVVNIAMFVGIHKEHPRLKHQHFMAKTTLSCRRAVSRLSVDAGGQSWHIMTPLLELAENGDIDIAYPQIMAIEIGIMCFLNHHFLYIAK